MALIEVKIPPMGESISSGILAQWHVNDGDVVSKDQALFELETDKITSEGTAEAAGRITFKAAAGDEVKIGQVVATIDSAASAAKKDAAPSDSADSSSKREEAPDKDSAPKAQGAESRAPVSPAVRRLAAETGIDPATISGTGKGGRVTKGDMLAAAENGDDRKQGAEGERREAADEKQEAEGERQETGDERQEADGGQQETGAEGREEKDGDAARPETPRQTAPAAAESTTRRETRKKMSPLRQKIAQRLVAAQHEAAMLTTFNEVDLSAVMALRASHQDEFVKKYGLKLGFMSFFAKAVVHALREVPAVNARLEGNTVVSQHYFDLGVAVSTEKGLLVPVIRNCDTLGMAEIEHAIADVAKRAREGKITLADLEGGVFTITNGGIFGSMLSTPILNPPQSGILGLHAINERPVARNGQVVIRPMMYIALSYDHRLVDGRDAVTFLVKVKQAIEEPSRLLLGV